MSSKPTRFLGQLAEFRHNTRRNRFFSLQHILLFLPTSLLSKTFLIFLVCSASPLAVIRSPSSFLYKTFFIKNPMISTPNFFLKVNIFCFCVVSLLFLLISTFCLPSFALICFLQKLLSINFDHFPFLHFHKSIFFSFSVKCSLYVHQCCTFCVAIQKFFFSILNHSGTITNHHNCITVYTTTLDKTC